MQIKTTLFSRPANPRFFAAETALFAYPRKTVGPLLYSVGEKLSFLEEEGNTPYCGDRYQRVDYPRHEGCLSAEDKRNQIEAENTDQPPVDPADNQKRKRNSVQHINHSFLTAAVIRLSDVIIDMKAEHYYK